MVKKHIMRKSALITLLFFIWFSLGVEFNLAQSDEIKRKMNKAVELYNQEDYAGSIHLLKEFINEIHSVIEQRKNVADACYLLSFIYYKQGEDEKSDESLKEVYDYYPAYYYDKEDLNFKDRVDRVKKEITEKFYREAIENYSGEDTPRVDEFLRKVFMISPDFEGDNTTKISEAFKNTVLFKIKKEAAEFYYSLSRENWSQGKIDESKRCLKNVSILLFELFDEKKEEGGFKYIIDQTIAESYYLKAKEFYMKKESQKFAEYIKKIYELVPNFNYNENDADFKVIVDKEKEKIKLEKEKSETEKLKIEREKLKEEKIKLENEKDQILKAKTSSTIEKVKDRKNGSVKYFV